MDAGLPSEEGSRAIKALQERVPALADLDALALAKWAGETVTSAGHAPDPAARKRWRDNTDVELAKKCVVS